MSEANSNSTVETENDYAFAPITNEGKVNVANHSHDDVRDHTYTVSMSNGSATRCTCPSDKYHDGACKHRQAVDRREDLLAAANPDPLAPVDRTDECPDCDGSGTIGRWSCFTCVRIGEGQ